MACSKIPSTATPSNSGELNVSQTGQATAESTKRDIVNLHYHIYERLFEALDTLEKHEYDQERTVNETYHRRMQILYSLERRMMFFKERAESRYAELASRESVDEPDHPRMREIQLPSSTVRNPEIRPIPFITTSNGKLTVNEQALIKLRQIHGRVGVLGMAGTFRTGKSFILSRIMGEQGGFPVASKVRACTQGIWMWGKHIQGTDNIDYLLVLDTEGLRDPKKGDRKHDTSIFALAMLLSSYLVYNAMNVIDFSAIRDLHLVANLHEHIRCRVQQDEKRVMPKFCWLVRDFSLSLEIDGQPCSEGEYLENALKLRVEGDLQANEIKRYLRDMFPDRHCVCLCKPTEDDNLLKQLDKQPYDSLRQQFTSALNKFIHHIYKNVQPLTVMGQKLTGSMFGTLAEEYVKAINKGAVPDISSTFKSLAEVECKRAWEESCRIYKTNMDREINKINGLPMDLPDLLKLHKRYEAKAMEHFDESCIGDKYGSYKKLLQDSIAQYDEDSIVTGEKSTCLAGGMYLEYVQRNETESVTFCEELLRITYRKVQNKMVSQEYFSPKGSLEDFFKDLDEIKDIYMSTKNKGPRANQVICDFFDRQTDTEQLVKFTEILSEADSKIMQERQKQTQLHLQCLKNNEELKKMRAERINQRRTNLLRLQKIYDQGRYEQEQLNKEHENKMTLLCLEYERLAVEKMNTESRRRRQEYEQLIKEQQDEQRRQNAELARVRQNMDESQREINRLNNLPDRQSSGGGGSCFSAWSTVRVKAQANDSMIKKHLWELSVGDEVETVDPLTGKRTFSLVYFIIHDEDGNEAGQELLEIEYEYGEKRGSITLHRNHLIYASDKKEHFTSVLKKGPLCAVNVQPEMRLWIMKEDSIQEACVTAINTVSSHPVRHPLTLNHYIIVDDVVASVHMFNEGLYRVLTSPLRGLYVIAPGLCTNKIVKKIVALWDFAEEWVPLTF